MSPLANSTSDQIIYIDEHGTPDQQDYNYADECNPANNQQDEHNSAHEQGGRVSDVQQSPLVSMKRNASYFFSSITSPSSCILLLNQDPKPTKKDTKQGGLVGPSSRAGRGITYWILATMCSLGLLVGGSAALLLGRLYFVHGGSRRWVYTCIESIGWPILLLPLAYLKTPARASASASSSVSTPTISPLLAPKTLFLLTLLGCLTAFDNLLYAWGTSYLPVSTTSLLCSSQVVFNAILACAVMRQRMTPFTVNAVVLLVSSSVVLVLHGDSDRPPGTSRKQYVIGCVVTVAASGLYALMLTLLELVYERVVGRRSFVVVLEVQTIVSAAATFFSLAGMWINGDFAGMREEAQGFELGSTIYAVTLMGAALGWQLYVLGGAGIIFLASSLMSSVFMTAMIPLVPVLAVFFFHDAFTADKATSLALALWGFCSYIYGSYLTSQSSLLAAATTNNSNNVNLADIPTTTTTTTTTTHCLL